MSFLRYISSQSYINLNFKVLNKKYINYIRLILLLFLVSIYYTSNIVLFVLIFFSQIILILIFEDLYLSKLFILYRQILYFSLNTIYLNYLINHSNHNNLAFSNTYFIYSLKKISFFYVKKFTLKFYIYYTVYQIPEYIKQLIILNTLYMITCYNISIFIKSETINITLCIYYKSIGKLKLHLYNLITINILISNQILEKNIERINHLYLGIKIKSGSHKIKIVQYIFLCINKLFDKLVKDQNDFNIILWIKSINKKFKNKIYID
uniref:hypothetical protein orf264 n=1 Tax=Pterosiphonia complanata TaxID=884089 RepID=UPI0022FD4CA4|nr:hypothetical protein orf264 [Pterosiphonia complanata]WAX03083.1 hypothetical protein orf264 [Pterosiphonia complanata]